MADDHFAPALPRPGGGANPSVCFFYRSGWGHNLAALTEPARESNGLKGRRLSSAVA